MGIIFRVIVMLLSFLVASPAFAGGQCYSKDELQAEQLLRLHSELMVITVTCHQSSVGEDLVSKYTGFTRKNIKVLHGAEQTMIKYYKANVSGDSTDHLDRLRTELANEYGQKIADMSAPEFCAQRRDKVVTMYEANPELVQLEVERMAANEKSYGHLCKP